MRKENDREVLISAWENEKNEERDCFDFISGKVMEYKIRYGEDEFIIDFTFEYLADRRRRYGGLNNPHT